MQSSIVDVYSFLSKIKTKNEKKITVQPKKVPSFLKWCQSVSPQYDFSYDWIQYVEQQQSKYNVILFSVPPQHGKSTTFTIHKAAYRLIYYPNQRGLIISYNSTITRRFHREILQILERCDVPLHSASQNEIVHANLIGSISFCGIMGGITSKPADWVIMDDPIRNAEDAFSPTYQDRIRSALGTSIFSRFQESFRFELTQTRWHKLDAIGQLIDMIQEKELSLNYKYINLPAICDEENDPLGRKIGDVLCPQRFSKETIKMKMLMAEADGYALYQGRPAPPEGSIFKLADLEAGYFNDLDEIPKTAIPLISVDAAFKETKTSDYVALIVIYYDIETGFAYVREVENDRLDFEKSCNLIRNTINQYEPSIGWVEDKANGPAIINTLCRDFPMLKEIKPEGGKIARAFAAQPFIRTHRLKIFKRCKNFQKFINQLISFPADTHDDMVDALTQAINQIKNDFNGGSFEQQTKALDSLLRTGWGYV